MARSLSLAAYMALARRGTQAADGGFAPSGERPAGAVIWGHATSLEHANALVQLVERLSVQRGEENWGTPGAGGLHLLLTTAQGLVLPSHARALTFHQPLSADNPAEAAAFLDHWRPDICLWTGGDLMPALLTSADEAGVPLVLVDADTAMLERPGWRWLPDMTPSLLARFRRILARSDGAARYLRRLGVPEEKLSVTGLFQEGAIPLPYDEALRDEMAASLRGRPTWLAAMVRHSELHMILDAHRQASRLAHRLFLILVPETLDETEAFRATLRQGNWRHAIWSQGGMPGEATQVLLADTRGEMGLWYRLATIAFMGNSLLPGMGGSDPNEPAAHGAAIVYGPNVARYLPSYKRYAGAGGARIVRDAGTLAAAVTHLIAADRSATMAHAAWEVATVGAEVTDHILDMLQDMLDDLEVA
ncbi:3-deoxy-D-manno-octulosonic-acid transferase [Roseovarius nanhaiticus]|uniref:3-deoxy-D-manno-octulosonic acid transferase n=1 Tax=Roseovarius nanhaiticus TaxID=573024 RepID=A0A1N7ET14_9RHOB|nr:glycosyltransferase N-terminal domain-containing protein [Roseovarius nanhaiticus]SEK67253.1 3-deoxy-D-manno-octulosonic-acid transferase [Roseovarius nanhaiticus]SIR91216.1 3-deoxy-D-manno-octulosonic-acid transferase [Roseovarius nanhaiticus]